MPHRLLPVLCLLLSTAAAAQHAGTHGHPQQGAPAVARPYAGLQQREVAGLDAQEVADLRAGRGMRLALPAELNDYPGPLHALELADLLGLSPAQRSILTDLVAGMRAATIPLGDALIGAERTLDSVFANGTASAMAVDAAAEAAALARGRLRAAHLRAHLATRAAMTEAQRRNYARLRGYAPP